MSQIEYVAEFRRGVETRTFERGAKRRTASLGRYVKKFLAENSGLSNEHGRKWSLRLCAEVLGVPEATLRRWVGKVPDEPPEVTHPEEGGTDTPQQEGEEEGAPPPEVITATRKVRKSQAKAALADPEQRREVIAALPPEVRDEVRADLIAFDLPASDRCHHCPAHCPEGGH